MKRETQGRYQSSTHKENTGWQTEEIETPEGRFGDEARGWGSTDSWGVGAGVESVLVQDREELHEREPELLPHVLQVHDVYRGHAPVVHVLHDVVSERLEPRLDYQQVLLHDVPETEVLDVTPRRQSFSRPGAGVGGRGRSRSTRVGTWEWGPHSFSTSTNTSSRTNGPKGRVLKTSLTTHIAS